MNRSEWMHYALFFAGVGLLVCATVVSVTAIGIAFEHDTSTDDPGEIRDEKWTHGAYEYEALSAEERRYVDGALAGERYVFDVEDAPPGPMRNGWSDHLIVQQNGQYHVFTRGPGVDWTSLGGIAAVVLAVGGILLIGEGIRRHHFPHYRPVGRFSEHTATRPTEMYASCSADTAREADGETATPRRIQPL